MKNAPFSVVPVMLVVYFVTALLGALIATIVSSFIDSVFWGLLIAALLPVPIAGQLRLIIAKAMASAVGATGTPPTAGSYVLRLGVGLAAAAAFALLLSYAPDPFGVLNATTGAMAAALTSFTISVIFVLIVSSQE